MKDPAGPHAGQNTTLLYRAAARAAVPLVPFVDSSERARAAHRARIAAPAAMEEWARRFRDRARPLAWFHAPSVGEGLQARAVVEAFRAVHPDAQVVYTHFSPSAVALAARMPADYAGYLPYDRPRDVAIALDALRPDVLVFTKLDLWPELATRAQGRGVSIAMIAATVLADSGRLRWPARPHLRPGYAAIDAAGASSEDDAGRLIQLGAHADRVVVTGDPRVDSVLAVAMGIDLDDPLTRLTNSCDTLVAGSTWPTDDAILLDAFARVRAAHPAARLVLVPHQPQEGQLRQVEEQAVRSGATSVRLSALTGERAANVLIVDRVGALARLYATGEIAYVGGGWGKDGIHSVLEPAALGRGVVIGPCDRGSADARLLADAGALVRLPVEGAVVALAEHWSHLLSSDAARAAMGRQARAALEPARGAAGRSVEVIERAWRRAQ